MSSAPTSSASPTKRRWMPRFGLRTLLVTMTLLGIGLGYVGMLLQRVRHQRHIVAQIEAAGGEVRYNWQFGMGTELALDLDFDYTSTGFSKTDDGRRKRTQISSKGTVVSIETPPGPWIVRRVLGDDVFAYVEEVSFLTSDLTPAEEFDSQLLLELPELESVVLTHGQVNDEWLSCMAQVSELRFLALLGYDAGTATSQGVQELESAARLEALSFCGSWVHDDVIAGIAHLPRLKSLALNDVPNITSSTLPTVGRLTELRELFIRRAPQIDDQQSEHLGRLKKLQSLSLLATSMSDATLAHLRGLSRMEYLALAATDVGDAGMECIGNLSELKVLSVGGPRVSDAGVESLARLPQLHNLNLGGTNVTDSSMPTLGRMTQLERLSLSDTSVTDCGVQQLGTLKNLRDLSLGETGVTDQGGQALRSVLPRKCQIYWSSF